MMYIYSAMLLHKAGKDINEDNVKNVLEAVGVKVDEGRVKGLVAALEGVNIGEVTREATTLASTVSTTEKPEAKKEKKEEPKEEKKEEEAAAGLGALFG